jgi:hypothetical protein
VMNVKTQEPQLQIVHVQIHIMKKKMVNVNYVLLDVLPVLSIWITVKSVEMIDTCHQSVHVFQVLSKSQILMN